MSWSKVVADKTNGGLGVGTLKAQNLAPLKNGGGNLKQG